MVPPYDLKIITRWRSALILLTVALLCFPLLSQQKKPAGPRAVAVLEWTNKGLRLIPLSLLIDGKFYDASLYHATPVPMALESENIYEVQSGGEPIGEFTVTQAEQTPNGSWLGQGKWDSYAERESRKAAANATKMHNLEGEEIDKPPVLRRPNAKETSAPATPSQPQTSPPSTSNAPAAAKTEPAPATSSPTVDDSGRPVLRRGKPVEEQAASIQDKKLSVKAPPKIPAGINKVQVAVSDASNTESRPYAWKWASAEEEQKLKTQVQKLALAAVAEYAAKVSGPKPGALEDIQVHTYDLTYNNEPDIILTARVTPSTTSGVKLASGKARKPAVPATPAAKDTEYFVTVVGREDIYGQLQKVFAQVTDNHHLDAYSKLNLIDAIDANGDGRADLLFRSTSDNGSSFVLYEIRQNGLNELIRVPEPQGD
jgi:hypothetical protein